MKLLHYILILILFSACSEKPVVNGDLKIDTKNKTIVSRAYPIILETHNIPGDIDTNTIERLNEPLKAMAAFYAAMGGTNCKEKNCELTVALGLGEQGSKQHKSLITKYFPNDKIAQNVVKKNCTLRPTGASTFSDYEYLTLFTHGDTVDVNYNLMQFHHGDAEWTKGPDRYLFRNNTFTSLKRNINPKN